MYLSVEASALQGQEGIVSPKVLTQEALQLSLPALLLAQAAVCCIVLVPRIPGSCA